MNELTTEPNKVVHARSRRSLSYGEIAAAGRLPDPLPQATDADLKPLDQCRYIGRRNIDRIDVPAKVNGTARFGIDVELPDMLYGAVLRAPVPGEKPDDHRRRRGQGRERHHPYRPSALWRRHHRRDASTPPGAPRTCSTSPGAVHRGSGATTAAIWRKSIATSAAISPRRASPRTHRAMLPLRLRAPHGSSPSTI